MAGKEPLKWYQIKAAHAAADGTTHAEIYIYGDIGESWWGESVAAKDFVRELAALDADRITVRLNSFGGSVSDGIAIHNAMRRHKATVDVAIDGTAYSIASLIAMAGDTVRMADNAMLMVHAPWAFASGNAIELREAADLLDTWAEAMTSSYARKTGDAEAARALLTDGKDHFFTAQEALDAGFVDEVTEAALPIAAHAIGRKQMAERGLQPAGRVIAPQPVTQPAAAAAKPESVNMTETVKEQAAHPEHAAIEAAAKAQALTADKARREEIRRLFAGFAGRPGIVELQQACEDDQSMAAAEAGKQLLAKLAEGTEPVAGGHVSTLEDEADKRRAAAENALLARAGLANADSSNPLRGYSLAELARAAAERSGYKTAGRQHIEYVGAAFTHSTSDFTSLLANVANKAMLKGYEEANETFQVWTNVGTLSDFKQGVRAGLGPFPTLPKVTEGSEYTYGTMGDRGEPVVLATYGRLFSITRQAIINDDLDAFTRIPRLMGRAAIRTIGDLVYGVLTGNPNMADSVALFYATHNNLIASGATKTAPSTKAVEAMRALMANQKIDGVGLNIAMKYLIVPQTLAGLANTVRLAEIAVKADGDSDTGKPNIVRGSFEVVADARLSGDAWYASADPAFNDTIEVSYLNGNQQPRLEQKDGWTVDGVEFKVAIDAGVKALDWRTLAKNVGA